MIARLSKLISNHFNFDVRKTGVTIPIFLCYFMTRAGIRHIQVVYDTSQSYDSMNDQTAIISSGRVWQTIGGCFGLLAAS